MWKRLKGLFEKEDEWDFMRKPNDAVAMRMGMDIEAERCPVCRNKELRQYGTINDFGDTLGPVLFVCRVPTCEAEFRFLKGSYGVFAELRDGPNAEQKRDFHQWPPYYGLEKFTRRQIKRLRLSRHGNSAPAR